MKEQKVKEEKQHGPTTELKRTHPAFGMIGASRVNGKAALFGTQIQHNGFVSITIHEAEEHISLHKSWYFPRKVLAEVRLSEAQWATFVSTMNVGSGVPCTVRHATSGNTEERPAIVGEDDWLARREKDIAATVKRDMAKLQEALQKFEALRAKGGSIGKKDFDEALSLLQVAVGYAPGNYAFAAKSVTEHAEQMVTEAKAEVTAFVTRMAMQYPQLEANAPTLQIEEKKS